MEERQERVLIAVYKAIGAQARALSGCDVSHPWGPPSSTESRTLGVR